MLEENLVVIDELKFDSYKTKNVVNMLKAVGADRKALIVNAEKNDFLIASAANVPGVKTALPNTINVYDIINNQKLILSKDALAKIEEVYA